MRIYLLSILLTAMVSFSGVSQSFVQGKLTGFSVGEPELFDINKDEKIDVIGLERFGFGSVGDLVIYLNRSVTDAIDFEMVSLGIRGIGAPAVVDLDGDNDLDIIVSEWDGSKAIVLALYNDGNLVFTKDTISLENVYRHKVADLNGDGALDIVSTNRDDEFMRVLINQGNGEFLESDRLERDDLHTVRLSDFDNDGDTDIIIGFDDFFDSIFILWNNNGNGAFTEQSLATSPIGSLSDFKINDVDNNGLSDIVFFGRNSPFLRVILQTAIGSYSEQGLVNSPNAISGFAIANFDSENDQDILLGGDNQADITFHLNQNEDPFDFADFEVVSGISPASFLEPGDLDGDGDLDVVVSNGDFWWLENKLNLVTANTIENPISDVKVFPNPFKQRVYIEEMQPGMTLEVFDINGNSILQHNTPIEALDVQDIDKGIYLFRITNKSGLTHSVYRLIKT